MSVPNSATKLVQRAFRPATNLFCGIRRKYYGPFTHVRTNSNLVALTFDDGPHPKFTVDLLKILASFDAKATFFMVGQHASRHPGVVKLVADHGHVIGNHSFSHHAFPDLDNKNRRNEIERCEAVLGPYMTKLFRPPFGAENILCHRDALHLGYQVIKWNIAPDDWREHSPEWIAERLFQQIAPGGIALLHDNVADNPDCDRTQTLEAVQKLLSNTGGRFTFCTVPQLLGAGTPMTSFQAI